MNIVLGIIRVLVILLIVRMVLNYFYQRRMTARRPTRVPERSGGMLVLDPNCGTRLPESRAIAVGRGDATVYFCSTACRDAWLAAHKTATSRSA